MKRHRKKASKKEQATLSLTRPLKPMLTQLPIFTSNLNHNTNIKLNFDDNNKVNCTNNNNNNHNSIECSTRFQKKIPPSASPPIDSDFPLDSVVGGAEILSQDFFCTPDYITRECQHLFNNLDGNKDNILCPPSPEKLKSTKRIRYKQDIVSTKSPGYLSDSQQTEELSKDSPHTDEIKTDRFIATTLGKGRSYVPQSAVALRCRVMPPPCIRNPYIKAASETDVDPFDSWSTKCSGFLSLPAGADSVSRYRADFQEIEQIGNGNFSCVFKVLKRIDGCMYAVKRSIKQLYQDTDRRKALMEVQALAALGFHQNLVAYYTSWFENEKLYIQMELCDYSLSVHNSSGSLTEEEVVEALYQVAKALKFIHGRGIAHLDLKPDNIYVKNGVFKLGDFGCATMLDKSLPIEEGDARYMPQEILNEKYDHLDKVDIFSLGVSIYELLRRSSLPETGHQLLKLGKLPLLPSNSIQLQNLLKAMVDPDPAQRPSAKELLENPIFSRILPARRSK